MPAFPFPLPCYEKNNEMNCQYESETCLGFLNSHAGGTGGAPRERFLGRSPMAFFLYGLINGTCACGGGIQ